MASVTVEENFLHNCAVYGNARQLRGYIRDKVNPCTADNYGLTPLMYSVWNGHVQCVMLFLANDKGVNASGEKCSCINLVSTRGYSALHLAVLDSPIWSAEECTYVLLCANADKSLRCSEGFTPYELAVQHEKNNLIEIFKKFESPSTELLEEIERTKKLLDKDYRYDPRKDWRGVISEANFTIPRFLTQKGLRLGALPRELDMHEQHIRPLVVVADKQLRGANAIHCLQFADEQAGINKERRGLLVQESMPDFVPPPNIDFNIPEGKRQRRKRRQLILN